MRPDRSLSDTLSFSDGGGILLCMIGCELLEFEKGKLTPCLLLKPNDAMELASTMAELALHGDVGLEDGDKE